MSKLSCWLLFRVLIFACYLLACLSAQAESITNLHQLTQMLQTQPRVARPVLLEATVCATSRPELGVIVLRDETGVELLELGKLGQNFLPGDRVRVQGDYCLLRQRALGAELVINPVVDNDGIHMRRTWGGEINLTAGRHPIRVEWFNHLREFQLELLGSISNAPFQSVESSNFTHAVVDAEGKTNFLPGLQAEVFEGYWEALPDFNLLEPVKTGVVTNLDLEMRAHDEMVGMRFNGFFRAPHSGLYQFRTRSDDGSVLFLGRTELFVTPVGKVSAPVPESGFYGETFPDLAGRRWLTITGRVGFIAQKGRGMEFELRSDHEVLSVLVADAAGLDALRLRNALVKVTGVGRGVLTANRQVILGKLAVASAEGIQVVDFEVGDVTLPALATINQVQSLPLEKAREALPVRVRGVVTDARNSPYERRLSLQDDTRGIFVNLDAITNQVVRFGDQVEILGRSGEGNFAPIIIAERVTVLGQSRIPEPARPTWTELLNGSMDVQWSELQGLVTDVQSNRVSLLLPEGRLEVQLDGYFESQLKRFEKSVVRVRGVLYAKWNAETREVRVGTVMFRNAVIHVAAAAPADVFDAVIKTPRQLRQFDAKASAFRRVKVMGKISYADATQMFLEDDGVGLRLLPSDKVDIHVGDMVEAIGYPDIGRTMLLLREVILRKVGQSPLPAATKIAETELAQINLDSRRVSVIGRLLGWHLEQETLVLEMQSGQHLYLARLANGNPEQLTLRAGSNLELTGVYVGRGRTLHSNLDSESFDLLLNSASDIAVLSQPSWWTLRRLLMFMIVLLLVLTAAVIWINQLRRQVEQRTSQLRIQIQEREHVERKHALEAERSRIARDLHDDLGSSLTEISVLANTGQRPQPAEISQANLFGAIAAKSRSLIAALDVIVWAVDPEDNSLQSLADYMTGHAEDFFSHTAIACRFKVPVAFPHINLDGRIRHDLLLAVKEALNNVVRHAEATEVEIRMAVEQAVLSIDIADNGKGFAVAAQGHGLKNLPARLLNLGGSCEVQSRLGGGTTVKIRLPLATA